MSVFHNTLEGFYIPLFLINFGVGGTKPLMWLQAPPSPHPFQYAVSFV